MIDPEYLFAILTVAFMLVGVMSIPSKDATPWQSVTWGIVTVAILVALVYVSVVDQRRPACPILPTPTTTAEHAP